MNKARPTRPSIQRVCISRFLFLRSGLATTFEFKNVMFFMTKSWENFLTIQEEQKPSVFGRRMAQITNTLNTTHKHTLDNPLFWIPLGTCLGLLVCRLSPPLYLSGSLFCCLSLIPVASALCSRDRLPRCSGENKRDVASIGDTSRTQAPLTSIVSSLLSVMSLTTAEFKIF